MAGELAPLVGVEDLGAAVLRDCLPHCVEAEVHGQRIEDSHANTLWLAPFQDGEERREASKHGKVGVVSSSMCSVRKMAQERMTSRGRRKAETFFRECAQAMDGYVQLILDIPGPVRLLGQVLA